MATLLKNIPNNITEYPNSFKRQGAFPLERYSVFPSYQEAKTYAETSKIAYVTQPIGVAYKNGEEVVADYYIIGDENGTLIHIGNSNHNLDEINTRIEEIEKFFVLEDGESLKDTLDELIELQKWIEEHLVDFDEFKEQIRVDLETEIRNRMEEDKYLSEAISAESTRATEAEEALRMTILQNANAINSEQVFREEADAGLSIIINTEKSDRQKQYTKIQADLNEETRRAVEEERKISQALNSAVTQLDNTIDVRCTLESTERANAIDKLQSDMMVRINIEAGERGANDELLQIKIDEEAAMREEQVDNLRDTLTEEVNTSRTAESELGRRLTSEERTRMNEDLAIMVTLNNEKQERQQEDIRLAELIEAETERANEADNKLYKALEEEMERANKADEELYQAINSLTEEDIRLKSNLYTYVPIGNAQKASNEVIGKNGSPISVTNRGLIGESGQSLKKVFDNIFGTEVDTEPSSITDSRQISYTYNPSAVLGATASEVGTAISDNSITITISASGQSYSTYGYYTSVDTNGEPTEFVYNKSGVTLYYTVATQTIVDGENEEDYKLKLVLPESYNANKVSFSPTPVHINDKEVYINADSVTVIVSNSIVEQTNANQSIYGQIEAYCNFEKLQDSNNNEVKGFLTYLRKAAKTTTSITNALAEKPIENSKSSELTVNKGSCFVYYAITNSLDNKPTSWTKYKTGQTPVSGLEIDVDAGEYLWIASVNNYQYLYLYNQLLGDYNATSALAKKDTVDLSFGTNKDIKITYNCYVTGPRSSSGIVKLELSNTDRGGN